MKQPSYQILSLTYNFNCLIQICPRKVFFVQNRKNEQKCQNPNIQISINIKCQGHTVNSKLSLKLELSLTFCIKFSYISQYEHHHQVQHVWISLSTKFQLSHITLISRTNSAKMDISGPKQRDQTSPLSLGYSN